MRILILVQLLLIKLNCFSQTSYIDSTTKIQVIFISEKNMFPESWTIAPVNGKAVSLDSSEYKRSKKIVSRALSKYPLEVLTKIATDPIKETPTGIASAKTEQISAIKAIADLLGWEAPKKSEIEVTDKTPIDLTNLTDEHLRTLAKIKSESGVS